MLLPAACSRKPEKFSGDSPSALSEIALTIANGILFIKLTTAIAAHYISQQTAVGK